MLSCELYVLQKFNNVNIDLIFVLYQQKLFSELLVNTMYTCIQLNRTNFSTLNKQNKSIVCTFFLGHNMDFAISLLILRTGYRSARGRIE